jgi:hypothetical protein
MDDNTFQQEVTRRLQTEIGNLIVQLTVRTLELEQARTELALLKEQQLRARIPGEVKEASNGNKQ